MSESHAYNHVSHDSPFIVRDDRFDFQGLRCEVLQFIMELRDIRIEFLGLCYSHELYQSHSLPHSFLFFPSCFFFFGGDVGGACRGRRWIYFRSSLLAEFGEQKFRKSRLKPTCHLLLKTL